MAANTREIERPMGDDDRRAQALPLLFVLIVVLVFPLIFDFAQRVVEL
jgi:hypothetical protein